MDSLGKLIESVTKPRYEEDYVDRLNYRVTSYVLLLAAFTIIAKEYGGDPIQCWLPAELASQRGWEQYVKDYCFVESTYFVKADEPLHDIHRHGGRRKLTYYQWVPFVLLFQALMFTVPHIFWRMLNWTSGIHTRAVITMANNAQRMNYDSKEMNQVVEAITKHLDRSLCAKPLIRQFMHSNPIIVISRRIAPSYLTSVYLITKLLFIANGFFQFTLLSLYLGSNGLQQLISLSGEHPWRESGFFPRETLCDFKVRDMGNQHKRTIQCVLMANMFNEKIFIALWWWILILITFTICNFIYWIFVVFSNLSKTQFLRGLLQLGRHEKKLDEYSLQSFMNYLGSDGILVFRLMTQNAGDIVSSIIAARLFDIRSSSQLRSRHRQDSYITLAGLPIPSMKNDKFMTSDIQSIIPPKEVVQKLGINNF